uniref:Uncharacterized protein n=1 Tax=Cyprinus carpio TaxID=7962 RepID=A0A8C1DDT0_CYPCA
MALLLDQLFAPLPDNNEIATKTFLESVSHLPPFFGLETAVKAFRTTNLSLNAIAFHI